MLDLPDIKANKKLEYSKKVLKMFLYAFLLLNIDKFNHCKT